MSARIAAYRPIRSAAAGPKRRRAERRNQVWSYDFVMDQTEDGRHLKMLPVVDEYTRECLTVEVARHFTAWDVIRTLAWLNLPRFSGHEVYAA